MLCSEVMKTNVECVRAQDTVQRSAVGGVHPRPEFLEQRGRLPPDGDVLAARVHRRRVLVLGRMCDLCFAARSEVDAKARDLIGPVLGSERTSRLLSLLWRLEQIGQEDVAAVVKSIAIL